MNENVNNKETNKNLNNNEQEEQNQQMKESNQEINPEELQKRIEELEKESNEWKEKFLRKAAEFENYKRRTENDQLNLINYAAESFIKKILPIVDDFERSLEHINDSNDYEKLKEGVQLIYNKLVKVLEEQGVKKIDAVGKPFDVEYHEALMQREDPSVPPHTVLDELEKGYMYRDKVIRHSKVVVSSEGQAEE
ncbi:MAG: nucleotide exchange factor GrpE [Ignavibacterium sp.]|jgi:molecular chaperone GrpE|uniref:Protein GrpE n=1 Tax=Ignavibacterium album TaxID=591197 RepID=A0A7V2ZKQ5_9BACT|nr:nucleotide exchange factor GrpE [Ignavibacterium album]MCA2005367.1 nucleotide exchange factor GrpE [Ignavibacterium sp.]MCX8104878.1 nucleotide exchange factor GrpE [Ignavibacterium album]